MPSQQKKFLDKRTAAVLTALLLVVTVTIYSIAFKEKSPFCLQQDCTEIASIDGEYESGYLQYMDTGQPGDENGFSKFRITSRDGIEAICALLSGLPPTREPADMQDAVGLTVHYRNGDSEIVIAGFHNQTTFSGPNYDVDTYALVETVIQWNEPE